MAVFSLTIIVLEIPTGVLADLLGKKNTLLLSRAMYIIEIFLIAFYNGFWVFLIAKIISGIGVSLGSGTNSAFLYDTLKRLNREKDHKKIRGNLASLTSVSMAFVFIIGAYLFSINPKLPAIVSLPLIALGFILTFFLKEPYAPSKSLTLANSWLHLKESLRYFQYHKYLQYLAFFSFPVTAAVGMMLSLSSAYFVLIKIPIGLIGIVAFCSSMVNALSSKKAHVLEEKWGEKRSVFIIQMCITLTIFLMSLVLPWWGLLFYFLIPLTQGFYEVTLEDYVNKHIETSHRATMLSINNMFKNAGTTVLFPLLGIGIKLYSMNVAFLTFGAFLAVYFIVLFIFSRNIITHRESNLKN